MPRRPCSVIFLVRGSLSPSRVHRPKRFPPTERVIVSAYTSL